MNLPFLETMITQSCNLSCLGCTNYSDLRHAGYVPWSQGKQQIQAWLDRLNIQEFGIIGGEPLINPEWREWVSGSRELMPEAQLRFTTNGLLLDRVPDIIDFFESIGNIVFKITVHTDNQLLEEHIQKIQQSRNWLPVVEYGVSRWTGLNNVRLQINRPQTFIKTYRNSYTNMMPWHSDPVQAFEHCCQRTCPLLYQGKIYKCSTAGLLKDTLKRFDNPNIADWQPYIDSGIDITDSDHVIQNFCNNFGLSNFICGQCPSRSTGDIDHYSNVIFKKKIVVTV
jgi:Radical SAM superfamily/4Fe-4S single cluster domain